ncbi:MAG: Uma2 family endonuclease [Planctomycetaceae bacterium]
MFRELDISQSALLTDIAMCINYYRLFTPGVYCCVHSTVQLQDGTRFIPGVVVQVNNGLLRICDPNPEYQYFNGPPNFVLDVFSENDMSDYEHRRNCYERSGVLEYVAVILAVSKDETEWIWNRLIDGKYREVSTEDNELIMSTALPGLWIPPSALRCNNWWAIMATIARGVSRVGHHQFMDTICGKNRSDEENRQAIDDYRSGQMGARA